MMEACDRCDTPLDGATTCRRCGTTIPAEKLRRFGLLQAMQEAERCARPPQAVPVAARAAIAFAAGMRGF